MRYPCHAATTHLPCYMQPKTDTAAYTNIDIHTNRGQPHLARCTALGQAPGIPPHFLVRVSSLACNKPCESTGGLICPRLDQQAGGGPLITLSPATRRAPRRRDGTTTATVLPTLCSSFTCSTQRDKHPK